MYTAPFGLLSLPTPLHIQPPHLPDNIAIRSASSRANIVDVVVNEGRSVLPSKDAVPSHQVEGVVGGDYGYIKWRGEIIFTAAPNFFTYSC